VNVTDLVDYRVNGHTAWITLGAVGRLTLMTVAERRATSPKATP
jgi:hypothetical protein